MYLSCVNVNSISCMVRSGAGVKGPHCSNAARFIYIMFGLSVARHMYFWVVHAQLGPMVEWCYLGM